MDGRGSDYGAQVVVPSSPDIVNQKFTSKERDNETGLDYFGARYFSGAQGRFTSTDSPFADQHPADPQSWNLYNYTRNNPLKYIDSNGRELSLAIYSGTLPQNVATAAANIMVDKLRNAGVMNVTYTLYSGSPGGWEVFRWQVLPTPHSMLLELRPNKEGDPTIPSDESGHNWAGQAAVDTSLVASQTNDPAQEATGIANLGAHEIGHEVSVFHPEGDPIMDRAATQNLFNPGLNFGPTMKKALRKKYNRPGETEQRPPTPPTPQPPQQTGSSRLNEAQSQACAGGNPAACGH